MFRKIAGHLSRGLDCVLEEIVVGGSGWFAPDISDKAWFVVLIVRFRRIHAVPLYRLVAFGTIAGIRVVGILHAMSTYPLFVTKGYLAVVYFILFVCSFDSYKYFVDYDTQRFYSLLYLIAGRAIFCFGASSSRYG